MMVIVRWAHMEGTLKWIEFSNQIMRVLFSAENCDFWFTETFVKFSGQSDADKSAKLQVGFHNLDIETVLNTKQATSPTL